MKCENCSDEFEPKVWQLKRKCNFICNKCYRIKSKHYRDAAKENGHPYISGKMGYEYHNQYMKDYKNKDYVKEFYRNKSIECRNNPEEIPKIKARFELINAIRRGEIKRMPCEICGNTKTDGHHENYSEPLKVKWLCRLHHKQEHLKQKAGQ